MAASRGQPDKDIATDLEINFKTVALWRKRFITEGSDCLWEVSIGTLDTLLVHPREVFRAAVVCSAAAVLLLHNHPSGDSTPSEADIKVTRDLIRAGQLLKIEVLDHIIIGAVNPGFCSLRSLGHFYT